MQKPIRNFAISFQCVFNSFKLLHIYPMSEIFQRLDDLDNTENKQAYQVNWSSL